MNAADLRTRLKQKRIPEDAYTLLSHEKSESLCLQKNEGKWVVFYSERGMHTNEKYFDNEDLACHYFLLTISEWFKKS